MLNNYFQKSHRYNPKQRGMSVSTVNAYLALGKALANEGITNNIFSRIYNVKGREREIDVLTLDEINTFLGH